MHGAPILADRARRQTPSAAFPRRVAATALSSDAVERLVDKHVKLAQQRCPALGEKRSPHTSCGTPRPWTSSPPASTPPSSRSGSATSRTETTQIYLHADMAIKQRALDRTAPHGGAVGRYRPPDALMAFLDSM